MRRKGDGKGPRLSMTGYGWLVEGFDGEEEEGMRGEKSEKWQQEVDERVTLARCSHIRRPGRGWGMGGGGGLPYSKVPVRR